MNLRRGETRTDVDIEVDVNKMAIKDNYPVVLPELFKMKIINLSVNGILLFSKADFAVGDYFSTVLSVNGNDIYIACQCMRKINMEEGFGYGCSMLGLSKSEQQIIRQYVFSHQIEKRCTDREKYARYLKQMLKNVRER
jgi:hypothetical protein